MMQANPSQDSRHMSTREGCSWWERALWLMGEAVGKAAKLWRPFRQVSIFVNNPLPSSIWPAKVLTVRRLHRFWHTHTKNVSRVCMFVLCIDDRSSSSLIGQTIFVTYTFRFIWNKDSEVQSQKGKWNTFLLISKGTRGRPNNPHSQHLSLTTASHILSRWPFIGHGTIFGQPVIPNHCAMAHLCSVNYEQTCRGRSLNFTGFVQIFLMNNK